ncbi:hypothetical protein BGX31_009758 [Mortierella sp. GBA43]|nr:hypothetical protein BGX31_009758 [Mortierella sp. GBA43]
MKDQYLELSTRLQGSTHDGRTANIFGLGENVGPFRKAPGTTTTLWARDHPCKPDINLYGSHPFYMQVLPSGSAHGVLLMSSNGMDVVFSSEGDQLTFKVIGGTIELYILTGPTPQQVIQHYMKDYKCFTFDEERFPVQPLIEYVQELHARDQHVVMILDPGIKIQYQPGLYEPFDQGVAKNLFIKRRVTKLEETEDNNKHQGDLVDFVGKVWPGKTTFPDWFHPEAQAYWQKYLSQWLAQVPLDGIWIDMNEIASFHDGDCSHIEASEDRPVRVEDFAMTEPEDSDAAEDQVAHVLQPQHQQQPQHKPSGTDPKVNKSTGTLENPKESILPKDAIAIHEHEYQVEHDPHYQEEHDPHHQERLHTVDPLESSTDQSQCEDSPTGPKPPVIYANPNAPPYRINNNNEHADLGYRTVSPDALHYGNLLEYDVHNLYGHMEAEITYNGLRQIEPHKKPFVLSRSTFPGSGRFTFKWNGDNWSTAADMKASIPGLLNFQLFGISMIGADIGGFGDAASEELLIRWHQLGAFYPFMRNHNCLGNPPQEPYVYKALADVTRAYVDMRYRLLPFWYTLFYRSHQDGHMVCSPTWVLDPTDQDLLSNDEQFLVGEAILVSPALDLKQTVVKARFPSGRWYDLHTGVLQVFVQQTNAKMAQGKASSKVFDMDAPLDKIPVHLRGGHILPRAGIESGELIRTTSQVRKAPIEILVALDETECAHGEYYHDDDSYARADGTLVKWEARPGLFTMSSFAANGQVDSSSSSQDLGHAVVDLSEPQGSRNLRPTRVQSIVVWGLGMGHVAPGKISKKNSTSCSQIESHQVRVSIVDKVVPTVKSLQHQRELSRVDPNQFTVNWDPEMSQLRVQFTRRGGLEVRGDQGLQVDWAEALVA